MVTDNKQFLDQLSAFASMSTQKYFLIGHLQGSRWRGRFCSAHQLDDLACRKKIGARNNSQLLFKRNRLLFPSFSVLLH